MTQPIQTESTSDLEATAGPSGSPEAPPAPLSLYRLSPRETQVAILTAEGLSADDLAADLGIRVGTVRNIRQALRRKLDVPPNVALNEALNAIFGNPAKADAADSSASGPYDAPAPAHERRVHLSVRQAITSIGQLADRLDARSVAVAAAAEHSRKSRERLLWEADQLSAIADDLRGIETHAIARVRAHLAIVAG
jgi:DNA-binding CsgD family transcriptional regulator